MGRRVLVEQESMEDYQGSLCLGRNDLPPMGIVKFRLDHRLDNSRLPWIGDHFCVSRSCRKLPNKYSVEENNLCFLDISPCKTTM